ncbi:hypothetical protein GCM10027429_01620 [Marivirga atlantica]|jgi:hypothetical protein|uniref:Peptidase E n=1 Tax=Marivirga atlantica TaxID=1548457 RepID=A0A937DIH0_9BACT|nr:DUF6702 family protein [Marivirga atlantica]MBL0763774.1 hypothetical protein [Marivirga atlantica]
MNISNYIIGLIFVLGSFHPFHVAVTELIYKEDDKAVQVMHRIFVDDFERTLNKAYDVNLDILALENTSSIDSLVENYLSQRFKVTIDGKEKELNYLGSELEEDVIWCYQEIYKVRKPETFEITNTMMFEEFDDQSNLIHTTVRGELKTIRLTLNERTDQVSFD